VAWALAFIWSVHPVLVTAWAADMGRTHLLAGTFLLASLMCHLRALDHLVRRRDLTRAIEAAGGGAGNAPRSGVRPRLPLEVAGELAAQSRSAWLWFGACFVLLVVSMLNKPMVGWVVVVYALEAARLGWPASLRSPRNALVLVVCAGFAALTLWTTRRTLMLEDSPLPLFGDPVARAALSIYIYLANLFAPGPGLSTWYPPDIQTGWGYWRVWMGVGLTALAAFVSVVAWRRAAYRGVAVGLVWFWAMWLPISGLVGARVVAAQDRYLYQPMIGLLLAIGVALVRWCAAQPAVQRQFVLAICSLAGLLGAAAISWNVQLAAHARSTLQRAIWAADRNPNDPRVFEMLAAAYAFGRTHHTLEDEVPEPPNWTALFEGTLAQAADLARKRPEFFRDGHDRAAFHRRLSYQYWELGREYERLYARAPLGGREVKRLLAQFRAAGYEEEELLEQAEKRFLLSLDEAQWAAKLEPEAKLTLVRLAYAYRSLGRWNQALDAFQRLERVLPPDAPDWALRNIDFGTLLLYTFNDPARAREKFQAALKHGEMAREARLVATTGLARCEVLVGEGAVGAQLVRRVLAEDPANVDAQHVLALYHLRSHHFEEAAAAYTGLLQRDPLDLQALLLFHEACAQMGNWRAATDSWQRAMELAPEVPVFAVMWVWSLACGAHPDAQPMANSLLESLPDNALASYALMLVALRRGAVDDAVAWARIGARGPALPQTRDHVRAEATLRLLIERRQLPPEAVLVHAALLSELGQTEQAQAAVKLYGEAVPTSPWVELAGGIVSGTTQPVRRPASQPSSAPAAEPTTQGGGVPSSGPAVGGDGSSGSGG